MSKAIILLSGGLDSVVSLASVVKELSVELAIIFDYGQKSFEKEFVASKKIADFYGVKLECIRLDFLKNITNTALVSDANVQDVSIENLNDSNVTVNSMKNVWVPNRNALFINIAASYADSFGYDFVVIGANKEEASTFSDNSPQFIDAINHTLEFSTNYDVKVLAPLIDFNKNEIVQKALELSVPLNYINSCYDGGLKHCGKCESCNRLKRALLNLNCDKIIKDLFRTDSDND